MKQSTIESIDGLVLSLGEVSRAVQADTNEIAASGDHIAIITHYDHLRQATARIKEAREALSQLEEMMSRELIPTVMADHNVKTVTIVGIGRVTVGHRYSCTMLDKSEGIKWLKDNGHGDIVQETVNSSTLAAFSKNLLENEGIELPDNIFKVGTSPYTSITKA